MSAAAALAGLHAAGVRVRLRNDGTVALDASSPPPAAVVAFAREHRDGIAALLWETDRATPPGSPHAVVILAGIPAAWCEGVALLASMPAPASVDPARWATLGATAVRLLRGSGAELHRAGWDALDLFGLNRYAPATYPLGWGLSWLLGHEGEVLEVTPEVVVVRHSPSGGRLAFRHSGAAARAGAAPAWALLDVPE